LWLGILLFSLRYGMPAGVASGALSAALLIAGTRSAGQTFRLEDAVGWREIEDGDAGSLWERGLPPDAAVAGYPEVMLAAAAASAFRHGQTVNAAAGTAGTAMRVYQAGRTFLGIGRMLAGGRVKPERLLHADHPGIPVVPA
jgi:tRNA U55 pseudouridine synthase TruB